MTPYDSVERQQLEARMKSGAHWFYWIAALSLVTSIISLAEGNWAFLVSLGVTQVIDGVARGVASELGWGFKVVAFGFDLIAAGLCVLLGYFATKRNGWAFIVGMALYALDALLVVVFFDILPLLFHAYVLYNLFNGYKATAALAELDRQTPPPAPAV